MMCPAYRACPFFLSEDDLLVSSHDMTTGRTRLCGVSRVHQQADTTSLVGYVLQFSLEHSPPAVRDCFCQFVVFLQVADLQIFGEQIVVAFDFSAGHASNEIQSLIGHMAVTFNQLSACLLIVPAGAAITIVPLCRLISSRYRTLGFSQFGFSLSQIAWRIDDGPITVGQEICRIHIYPDSFPRLRICLMERLIRPRESMIVTVSTGRHPSGLIRCRSLNRPFVTAGHRSVWPILLIRIVPSIGSRTRCLLSLKRTLPSYRPCTT